MVSDDYLFPFIPQPNRGLCGLHGFLHDAQQRAHQPLDIHLITGGNSKLA
jgi:hypothetical protein